jgi:hypothetical protein
MIRSGAAPDRSGTIMGFGMGGNGVLGSHLSPVGGQRRSCAVPAISPALSTVGTLAPSRVEPPQSWPLCPPYEARAISFPRCDSPGLCLDRPHERKRAQGVPDAGRTREPCVQKSVHSAHARNHRAAEQPALPAQWVTAYTRSPRCTGLSGHRRLALVTQGLIPASGDRDNTTSPSASNALVCCADTSTASRRQRS